MKKAKAKHKTNMRKSQNFSISMQKSRLEKLIKKKDAELEHLHEESYLTSPTSLSMKNSFLIKTVGKSFEAYFSKKNKKKIDGKNKISGHKGSFILNQNDLSLVNQTNKIQGFSLKPRDGHSGVMINEREYVIFGGDRHHMPFNDLAGIDLSKEL